MAQRLFVAVEIPDAIRERLGRLPHDLRGARWVKVEQLHLTLRFIGDVEPEVGARIAGALATVQFPRFELTVRGAGVFPSPHKPRVLWVGIDPRAEIPALKAGIDAVIEVPDDEAGRAFHPHLTLARLREADRSDVQALLQKLEKLSFEPFWVDHFTLFESELGRDGAKHRVVQTYPLLPQ